VICHLGIFCYVVLQLLPLILDVILPLNESRSCEVFTITEYFINREKYICAILFHEMTTVYVGMMIIWSTIMTIMMYILHGCAMFDITWYNKMDLFLEHLLSLRYSYTNFYSYRMENAIEKNILAIPDPIKSFLLHQRIIDAILMHRRAIRLMFICFLL